MPHFQKTLLQGQRALVIGSDTGMDAAVAEALAEAGAKVMVNYLLEREQADQVAKRIRAKQGQAMIFQADVSKENQVKSMFDVLIAYWGSIDILVTNISLQIDGNLVNMSLEQWQRVISNKLTGQFLCVREAAREFLRRGIQPELSKSLGKIICLSSTDNSMSFQGGYLNDAICKNAVSMLVQTLAQELRKDSIRVNGISPIGVKNSGCNHIDTNPTMVINQTSLRPYRFDDIAKATVWLASDDSKNVCGETFYIRSEMAMPSNFDFRLEIGSYQQNHGES